MRIRLKKHDLLDLARLYRAASAPGDRRQAADMAHTTQEGFFIEAALRKIQRAEKLEYLAAQAEDFILMTGGPP